MLGQTKTTLMFAGGTLLAAGLFAFAFQSPPGSQPAEGYGSDGGVIYDDGGDYSDGGDYEGTSNSGPSEEYGYTDDSGDHASGDFGGEGAFSDDALIDDTKGFDPAPMLSTDGISGDGESSAGDSSDKGDGAASESDDD